MMNAHNDTMRAMAAALCDTANREGQALGLNPADVIDAFAGALAAFVCGFSKDGNEASALGCAIALLAKHGESMVSSAELLNQPASATIN